jgi:hypothetical protein
MVDMRLLAEVARLVKRGILPLRDGADVGETFEVGDADESRIRVFMAGLSLRY